jgi:dCTP deaminase
MILTGSEIEKQVREGKIWINPYEVESTNPNSYDFRLANKLKVVDEQVIDPKKLSRYSEVVIPPEGFLLEPGKLYLGSTVEEIGSDYFVPLMQAKSSIGRLGLSICLNSGFGDLGYKRSWTLVLSAIYPTKIYSEMKVGQIYFLIPEGKIKLYDGHYQTADGPVVSQLWRISKN